METQAWICLHCSHLNDLITFLMSRYYASSLRLVQRTPRKSFRRQRNKAMRWSSGHSRWLMGIYTPFASLSLPENRLFVYGHVLCLKTGRFMSLEIVRFLTHIVQLFL